MSFHAPSFICQAGSSGWRGLLGGFAQAAWRIAGVALCFAAFGAGALLLGFGLPLACRVLGLREPARRRVVRRAIHRAFAKLVSLATLLGLLRVEVEGREHLQVPGRLIVANHPSLIDVVLLMSLIEEADCVVKPALAHHWLTRWPVRAAGYRFDGDVESLIAASAASLGEGHSLIIFPEGTRTPASGVIRLRRGAAAVAVRGKVGPTPVRIHCSAPILGKGQPWYRIPSVPIVFRLQAEPPWPPVDPAMAAARAVRELNLRLERHLAGTPSSSFRMP